MALATNSIPGSIVLAGDLTGSANAPELRVTGVVPGTYFPASIVVDAKGRLIHATNTPMEVLADVLTPATPSTLGAIQLRAGETGRTGLVVNNGVLELGDYQATYTLKGFISVSQSFNVLFGRLYANPASNLLLGSVKVGDNLTISSGVVSRVGTTIATNSTTGVVRIGSGLSIAGDGTLSLNAPIATNSTTGLIKTGTGISAAGDGTLSLNAIASAVALGYVKPNSSLAVDGSGLLSVNTSGFLVLNAPRTVTKRQAFAVGSLSGTTVDWNGSADQIFTLSTTATSITINNGTNVIPGTWYHFIITHTQCLSIAYGSQFKFRSGSNNRPHGEATTCLLSCYADGANTLYCIMQPNFI